MSGNDSVFKISSSVELSSTSNILEDARTIIESSQRAAHAAVNIALVQRNWLLGKRIAEEFLEGDERANYGKKIVGNLSKALTDEFGKGFSRRELYWYLKFFRTFPEIVNSASTQYALSFNWRWIAL